MITRYTEARLREYLRSLVRTHYTDIRAQAFVDGVQCAVDCIDGKQLIHPDELVETLTPRSEETEEE